MKSEEKRQWAILQLQCRAEELGCLPKKADFPLEDTQRIKAYLGPWPRALETAGLRPRKKPAGKRKNAQHAEADGRCKDGEGNYGTGNYVQRGQESAGGGTLQDI